MSIERIDCPAELAKDIVLYRMETDPNYGNKFGTTQTQEHDLACLDKIADQANFFGDWYVKAGLGFMTPIVFDANEDVEYVRIDHDLNVDGSFECYSWLSIGKLAANAQAVRAMCMTFTDGVVVWPDIGSIKDDSMLHIPVMAIKDIERREGYE